MYVTVRGSSVFLTALASIMRTYVRDDVTALVREPAL